MDEGARWQRYTDRMDVSKELRRGGETTRDGTEHEGGPEAAAPPRESSGSKRARAVVSYDEVK